MATLVIRNGTIVTATDTFQADLLVENEKVVAISKNLSARAEREIDATGCYIFPGGIDAHTHLDLPFMGTSSSDDFETGTLAALHGGTTTIIDFAFQTVGKSLKEGLYEWHKKAEGKAAADYAFHVAVVDFNEKTRQEIKDLIEKEGVTSFKTFMAYKGALMIDDRQMIGLMNEVKKWGGIVTVHAENGDLADSLIQINRERGNKAPRFHALSRPEIVESEATGRAIDIAFAGQHPVYIVHMTCEGALNRVKEATKRNQRVLVETCIQYLLLDDSVYERPGFEGAKWVMSPPLRKPKDQEALFLRNDSQIEAFLSLRLFFFPSIPNLDVSVVDTTAIWTIDFVTRSVDRKGNPSDILFAFQNVFLRFGTFILPTNSPLNGSFL